MSGEPLTVREQIRRNAVALISLVVAVTSLGYNTWRNERTEANRNVRAAGFQLMAEIVELEQVVFLIHYDMDDVRGNPRIGWVHVLAVRDLAFSMPDEVQAACQNLYLVWQQNWESLGQAPASLKNIETAIDTAKAQILGAIQSLS